MNIRNALARIFRRPTAAEETLPPGDMRTNPIDNPLDFREDGSIREGDPAWAFLNEVMQSGKPGIANQNEDGTWATELDPHDRRAGRRK